MNRLVCFFLEEQQVRWKVYLTSGGIAFAYALVNLFAFHRSESRVGIETFIVLFILVTICVMAYVARSKSVATETRTLKEQVTFDWRLALAGATVAVVLVSMYEISIPELQAKIANFRLKSLATFLDTVRAASLSDEQLRYRYQKIESIVGKSSKNQIPVDPTLLQNTQSAISSSLKYRSTSDQTKQLGLATAIDLESLSYTRKVQTGAITTLTPQQFARSGTGAYPINSTVPFDKKTLYIRGENSWIMMGPSGGSFAVTQSNIVFDKINFVASTSIPPIELGDDRSSILVRNSVMRNVTQSLDRITWIDVQFENSQILYSGGPLKLRGVSFKDCVFKSPPIGTIAVELAQKINVDQVQPITLVYEPQ